MKEKWESGRRHALNNVKAQVVQSAVICVLAVSCYLPLFLDMKLNFDKPHEAYSDEMDSELITVANAIVIGSTGLMLFEALLDSQMLYLPIGLSFPRFVTILGFFIVSIPLYFRRREGIHRLNFIVCSLYAKGYFLCGGLSLNLLRISTKKSFSTLGFYVLSNTIFVTSFQLLHWSAYFEKGCLLDNVATLLCVCSVLLALCYLYRVGKLFMYKERDFDLSYQLISHLVICIFVIGRFFINLGFGFTEWEFVSSEEVASYLFLDLFAIALLFFKLSYAAQRYFVSAKGELSIKKTFVRYISHEVRNPLNAVSLGLELLVNEIKRNCCDKIPCWEKANVSSLISDLGDSCNIAVGILNDLLLIDKIEDGKLILDKKPTFLITQIKELLKQYQNQARMLQKGFSSDLSALEGVKADVDEGKFSQVIRNIISNAIKFTPSGGYLQVNSQFIPSESSPASATASNNSNAAAVHPNPVSEVAGKVRIEFLDTGPGMPMERKRSLFINRIQFDPNVLQSGQGSGLGLWISNAIMLCHDGSVGVMHGGVSTVRTESGVNLVHSETAESGCMFFVEMPGRREVAISKANSCSSKDNKDATYSTSGLLIRSSSPSEAVDNEKFIFDKFLIVDDSKLNRRMMEKILSPFANSISVAEDGAQAVEIVKENMNSTDRMFDVIFMDSLMPNMNGIEATKIILGELKYQAPVIAVTGNMLPDDVLDFMRAGAQTVLGKPLQVDTLKKILYELYREKFYSDTSF